MVERASSDELEVSTAPPLPPSIISSPARPPPTLKPPELTEAAAAAAILRSSASFHAAAVSNWRSAALLCLFDRQVIRTAANQVWSLTKSISYYSSFSFIQSRIRVNTLKVFVSYLQLFPRTSTSSAITPDLIVFSYFWIPESNTLG